MSDLTASITNVTQFNADQARHTRHRNGIEQSIRAVDESDYQNRAEIRETAKQFEAMMLSQMVGYMFTDIDPNGPFGGGHGEEVFRSFLTEEYGKTMAESGSIGVADQIENHLIQLQEQARNRRTLMNSTQAYKSASSQ